MDHVRVAPGNATARELVVAEICDPLVQLADRFDAIRANDRAPAPHWLPYLVAHYGLGELLPYVRNLSTLVSVGPGWQRRRGTPAAVRMGIGWVGYSATFEWAPPRRRRWHLWQVALDRLPDSETDLDPLDGIASLSDDAFSHFWRGSRGWDVRPHETGRSRWGRSLWGASSGVRVRADGALWSFGRSRIADRIATEAELTGLGVWIPPAGASSAWSTMHYPWSTATYPWAIPGRQARRRSIATALAGKRWHFAFRRADGSLIGACRAVVHPVAETNNGAYAIGSARWSPSTNPSALLAFCRTPFQAVSGDRIATIDLVADAVLAAGVGPGRAWLAPAEIEIGAGVAAFTGLDVTMSATIREIVHLLLRID